MHGLNRMIDSPSIITRSARPLITASLNLKLASRFDRRPATSLLVTGAIICLLLGESMKVAPDAPARPPTRDQRNRVVKPTDGCRSQRRADALLRVHAPPRSSPRQAPADRHRLVRPIARARLPC